MKKPIAILAMVAASLVLLAQTASNPQPIDWRFSFLWDDPNPKGMVASWSVFASNGPTVRVAQSRTNNIDALLLLQGLPVGNYQIFTTATSILGDVSEQGQSLFILWTGKVKPGNNPRGVR